MPVAEQNTPRIRYQVTSACNSAHEQTSLQLPQEGLGVFVHHRSLRRGHITQIFHDRIFMTLDDLPELIDYERKEPMVVCLN